MAMTKIEQWESICPLCGGANQCAMAAGRPAASCWCQTATISAEALAAIPAESAGKRCLCPACGQEQGEQNVER